MKMTTARVTGLLYLGVAVTGAVSFLFANQKLFVDGDALATATNLANNEGLARLGIAFELALVGFQALVAVWFYKLFRKKDSFTAGLIALAGMVNAIAILIASAVWLGALNYALDSQPDQAMLLYNTHENIWTVASLFFGLWLIPMGIMVKKYRMPEVLSWILILGGVGYVLSTFSMIIWPEQKALADSLPLFATVGEFWIIGYLLFKEVKE